MPVMEINFGELMRKPEIQALVMGAYAWGVYIGHESGKPKESNPYGDKLEPIGAFAMHVCHDMLGNLDGPPSGSPLHRELVDAMVKGLSPQCEQAMVEIQATMLTTDRAIKLFADMLAEALGPDAKPGEPNVRVFEVGPDGAKEVQL